MKKYFTLLFIIFFGCKPIEPVEFVEIKNVKIDKSVKNILKEEEIYGIKDFKTYQNFAKKVYAIRKNVIKNIDKIKKNEKTIVGYGAPAKATTALNFFGISNKIDYIVEDNQLKHNKFIPGVNIPIYSKKKNC